MKRMFLLATTILVLITPTYSQSIIPLPQKTEVRTGKFRLTKNTTVFASPEFITDAAELLSEFEKLAGYALASTESMQNGQTIQVLKTTAELPAGGYELEVTPEKVVIKAKDSQGAFYGCMSLLQSIPFDRWHTGAGSFDIPATKISDFPRFLWRGLMLDCSRTFMPPSYLKQTIDRMAFYKLNKLHLHLTDDQGWRLEIKSRPLLTEKGARFADDYHEPEAFQGFYSVEDIKDLLAYAAKKHVDIVPEIECPGHNHAALFAYPDLSCAGQVSPIYPFFAGEGITNDIFCVGNPESQQFFKEVLSETAALFPSNYIHLGGDEVPTRSWQNCPKCQQLVQTKEVKNTAALQGYFMNKVAHYVITAGKRPIGWDEVFEDENGYISKDWIIMSWRGSKPGLEAIKKGYDVIMSPTSHMYFDYGYDATNSEKVFKWDPCEGIETEADKQHVLGMQANFWSHIDRTQSRIDSQLYPRLLAVAERSWSSVSNTDYENFKKRKSDHLEWLKYMKVWYNYQEK